MSWIKICALSLTIATVCALMFYPAEAGARPKIDLSVTVITQPEPFIPGGISTFTMTVHNAGPDLAGSTLPNQPEIAVFEQGYNITNGPPPYVLFEPAVGCWAVQEESEYIPGTGFFLDFIYYFEDIAPGESRTCIYRVRFLESTQKSFATYWLVYDGANDDDINPGNDRFDHVFEALPVQIPTLSGTGALVLCVSLILAVARKRRRRHSGAEFLSDSTQRSSHSRRASTTRALILGGVGALMLDTSIAVAARPKVDLSVTVTTTEPIVPGGISLFTMTVHNAGPDTAGSVLSDRPEIIVSEKSYNISNGPPPYEMFEPAVGCANYAEDSEYFPGQGTFYLLSFHFDDIAAGESRTCTYRVRIRDSTRQSFATYWTVFDGINDDDIDSANDRFDHVFVVLPTQIPTLSAIGATILSLGLMSVAGWKQRRRRRYLAGS